MIGERYIALSQKYLDDGEKYLDEADWPQASEKFWGASAEIVKAVAETKGWQHSGHRLLFQIVSRLAEESNDQQIDSLFHSANSLHINFYEDLLTPSQVRAGASAVREFIQKLRPLVNR